MNRFTGFVIRSAFVVAVAGIPTICARAEKLAVSIEKNGDYAIAGPTSGRVVLRAGVAAEVNHVWIHSGDYPSHTVRRDVAPAYFGTAQEWQVSFTGLTGKPDLTYRLRVSDTEPFAYIEVTVHNSTGKSINVECVRALESTGASTADLEGPAAEDRVLSDSFSEDRPAMRIHDLGDAEGMMHRAVGSQLIYNRNSRQSLFVGAVTSNQFLSILRLHLDRAGADPQIAGYEVDSTGTTELEDENSLQDSPPQDRVALSLPVAPDGELSSETVAISTGEDYHRQLETYGRLIRQIHHARVSAPPLMGWWSWTAWYFGLNAGTALTDAEWEAQHLKSYGYTLFHIDEGYQYARGQYATPNATLFPDGLAPLEYRIRGLGLTPGIWTAPFEVSVRSSVYQHHQDWLVKNEQGQPIHAGSVAGGEDPLYILDTTNPGAQQYLRDTYTMLVHDWGIHYIKLDFMDDSAIEGEYYKPHTTAMEAQRIGLGIIRDTVGDGIYLDKDGSVMLNPVGLVDYGRVSVDTGHSFEASRDAATGIAARYYMNRNFFVSDPDAFTVSMQHITDQSWHQGKQPLTLAEAQVSIALAAVSGGMLEIGDNLPSLENSPQRLALIQNPDLINMVRLGKASVPVDLMSYASSDQQPSIFLLRESRRQSILTVFDWTERPTSKTIALAQLGLSPAENDSISEIFDGQTVNLSAGGSLQLDLAPHSVRVLKIIDRAVPVDAPSMEVHCAQAGSSGEDLDFSADEQSEDPAISWKWDFGDGVIIAGSQVRHTWTEPGDYTVRVTAEGLDGKQSSKSCAVHISGHPSTVFAPALIRQYEPPE